MCCSRFSPFTVDNALLRGVYFSSIDLFLEHPQIQTDKLHSCLDWTPLSLCFSGTFARWSWIMLCFSYSLDTNIIQHIKPYCVTNNFYRLWLNGSNEHVLNIKITWIEFDWTMHPCKLRGRKSADRTRHNPAHTTAGFLTRGPLSPAPYKCPTLSLKTLIS